jgi:cytochrome oxidase assembly protein ShyY1
VLRRLVPSRSYLWLLLVAVALAALFVRLGFWQLHRLHERQALRASASRAEHRPPAPLARVAASVSDPDELAYRRVSVSGRYDRGRDVVLYGRALRGRPGNHVLTPLITASGRAIVVDRGWVPAGLDRPPVRPASPPGGTVAVTGLLLPPEEATTGAGRVEALTRIDLERMAAGLPYPIYRMYLQLQEQEPAQPGALPVRLPPPDLSGGPPNLSYAIQWFTFAAIALVGYVVLTRRRGSPDPDGERGEAPRSAEPASRPSG